MAIFHSHVSVVKRSAGHSSIAAACYRTGERIVDERTGEVHDYNKRSGVVISEIFRPEHSPAWMSERSMLWNAVEKGEARKDAQLCRTWDAALPAELTAEQRLELVRNYCKQELVHRGMVVDMSIHSPHKKKRAETIMSILLPPCAMSVQKDLNIKIVVGIALNSLLNYGNVGQTM